MYFLCMYLWLKECFFIFQMMSAHCGYIYFVKSPEYWSNSVFFLSILYIYLVSNLFLVLLNTVLKTFLKYFIFIQIIHFKISVKIFSLQKRNVIITPVEIAVNFSKIFNVVCYWQKRWLRKWCWGWWRN